MRRREALEAMAVGAITTTAGCITSSPNTPPPSAWEYDISDVLAVEGTETRTIIAAERELVGLTRDDGDVSWQHSDMSIAGLERDENSYYAYGSGGILAVDPRNGKKQWDIGGSYQWLYPAESTIVCYASNGRETRGLDPETGETVWTWEGDMIYTYTPTFGLVPGDEYRGFNLEEGSVTWTFNEGDDQTPVTVADGVIVFWVRAESTAALVALDQATGTEQWRFEVTDDRYGDGGVIDGTLYASIDGGTDPTRLHAIDIESGRNRWSTTIETGFDVSRVTPDIDIGGTVIATAPPNDPLPGTCAIDRTTGTIEWCKRDHELITTTDDYVVLEGNGGDFVGLEPDGSAAWEGGMQAVPRVGSPASDGLVYTPPEIVTFGDSFVAAFTGTNAVESWDATAGTRRWRKSLESTVDALFAANDDLYIVADGTLSAVDR